MASFDGLDRSMEIPFDNVQSQENAINKATATFLSRQRTQWDTSNIVSGHTLAASNVQGAGLFRDDQIPWRTLWDTSNIVSGETLTPANVQGEGVFRNDQIPWSGAPGDVMANIVAPYVASGTIRVPGSNVYGPLGDPTTTLDVAQLTGGVIDSSHLPTTLDVSHLTGGVISSTHLPTAPTIFYTDVSGTPTSLEAFLNPGLVGDRYARLSDVTTRIDVINTAFNTTNATNSCLNIEISSYDFASCNVNATFDFGAFGSVTDLKYNYVYANTSTITPPGIGPLTTNNLTNAYLLLTNVGVHGSNIHDKIKLENLPTFLTPTISYDVTSNVTPLHTDLGIINHYTDGAGTINTLWDDTWPDAANSVHKTRDQTKVHVTSNMRFSLGGFSNLGTDYLRATKSVIADSAAITNGVSAGSMLVSGDINCSGTITGNSIKTSSGTDLANVKNETDTALALAVVSTTVSAGGIIGLGLLFGGIIKLPTGWVDGGGSGGSGGSSTPQKTLAQLIAADPTTFTDKVNIVIKNYLTNEDNVVGFLNYIQKSLNLVGKPRGIFSNASPAVGEKMLEILNKTAQSANMGMVENPAVSAARPVVSARSSAAALGLSSDSVGLVWLGM